MTPLWVQRFWEKIDRTGDCWPWTGSVSARGYARTYTPEGTRAVHRIAYELLVGPIPDGLILDHLCHTNDPTCPGGKTCPHRRCCNPEHLEPVTNEVNVLRGGNARKTHCPQGHPYGPESYYVRPADGRKDRRCPTCRLEADKRYQAKKKEAS